MRLLWVRASRLPNRIEAMAITVSTSLRTPLLAAGEIWNRRTITANTATFDAVARNAATGAGAPS
ncbi:hypothetical protein D3C72_2418090 [compost metagenome]